MKIKEIKAAISGVIPIASYENLRPYYEISAELEDGEDIQDKIKELRGIVRQHFEQEGNRAKADLIEKQYQNIRLYEKDGKKYPSVTSITGWDVDWKITEDELQQYAARGTVVHNLIEVYLATGKWFDPINNEELQKEIAILMSGSKKLTWQNCSYKKAVEAIMPDIKVIETEKEIYNDEQLYAGRADLLCLYKGKQTIMDFKSGTTTDMRQLAAYASCIDGVEQLMIVPVGPTDNKSGLKKPIVTTDITGEYKKFLYARAKFRERFGI